MNGPDRNEDLIQGCAEAAWIVLCLIGLAVLLSGHGIASDPSAPRVSPTGVTTTMGDASHTP